MITIRGSMDRKFILIAVKMSLDSAIKARTFTVYIDMRLTSYASHDVPSPTSIT